MQKKTFGPTGLYELVLVAVHMETSNDRHYITSAIHYKTNNVHDMVLHSKITSSMNASSNYNE